MEKNRVLVISVSSWNEKIGSNTWKEVLSFLDDTKIGCISLRPGAPEKKYSENYLIYDEKKIIKSIFNKKIVPCYVYSEKFENENESLSETPLKMYNHKSRLTFLKRMVREFVWKLSKWKNETLNKFISDFNPTHVVYFMDGYIHANRLCRYVKKQTNAKTIGYFVDDTFSYKQRKNILFFIHRFFQRKSIRKLVKTTDVFWSINSRMKDEVQKVFGADSTIVTKPLREIKVNAPYCAGEFPLKILYAGNLEIGRVDSLNELIKSIKEININKTYFELDIYSSYEGNKIIKDDFVTFHGPVNQSIVFEKYNKADILLFLESITKSTANIARLSFSTKITDYLSYCKPIIAVGSDQCFPVYYLSRNGAALCAQNGEEIINILRSIILNKNILNKYALSARELGKKNHSRESICRTIRSFFD